MGWHRAGHLRFVQQRLDAMLLSPEQGGLVANGLVYRYNVMETKDGLRGEEGTFNICTFWLVEALTRAGKFRGERLETARLMFERMLGFANHVGLYAEETGPRGRGAGELPAGVHTPRTDQRGDQPRSGARFRRVTKTSAIQVSEGSHLGWRALWLRGPEFALALVPEVGGRIMGIEWRGQQLAFANPDLAGRTEQVAGVADVRARKRALGFLLWGGDKTWLAPQARWTDEAPFLDLDSGAYDVSIEDAPAGSAKVRLTSPVCRESGIQIERCIRVAPGTQGWHVTHQLRNCSAGSVAWAPWIVAMFRRPAQVFLPTRADSAYPDGVKTYAEEGESRDVRSRVVTRVDDGVRIDCTGDRHFKFGTDAAVGTALAVLDLPGHGRVGIRKQVPTFHPRPYAHGCIAEVFNSAQHPYFELELHGPVLELGPGESFALEETVRLEDVSDEPH